MAFGLAGLTRGRKEKKSTSSTFQASLRPPTRSIDCIANLLITLAGMDCPIDCIANLLITLAGMDCPIDCIANLLITLADMTQPISIQTHIWQSPKVEV